MSHIEESSPSSLPAFATSGLMSLTSGTNLVELECSDDRAVEVRFIADHSRFRSTAVRRKWGWMRSSSGVGHDGRISVYSSRSSNASVDELVLEYRKSGCVLLVWMTSDVDMSRFRLQRHLQDKYRCYITAFKREHWIHLDFICFSLQQMLILSHRTFKFYRVLIIHDLNANNSKTNYWNPVMR